MFDSKKNKLKNNMLSHSALQNLESIHLEQSKASEMDKEIKIRAVSDYFSLKADRSTEKDVLWKGSSAPHYGSEKQLYNLNNYKII